ncbi:MAG: aminoacetone oxidase family FAD-binding enzyme [Sulfurospirillum sp.]|nr:MAG: aminoacetone oxidase family FAD-binding enzyme [Sulfurospirillum sp.]
MVKKEIIVIGAGASGLMAASRYRDRDIALLEGNARPAEKIKISGGGKCNITNKDVSPEHYLGDPAFTGDILAGFTQRDLLAWLRERGLDPVVRKGSQYFCPRSSQELISLLLHEVQGVPLLTGHKVLDISKEEDFIVTTDRGEFEAKKVVVAAGGLSFPKIGATDIAFRIAEKFGHTVHTPKPALVGFTLQKAQFWMKSLSGISLPVHVNVGAKSITGDMLFAHRGISGPAILNSSLYWQKGEIVIDFLPGRQLDDRLFGSRKQISTVLGLPRRFMKAFLDAIGLKDQPLCTLDHEAKAKLEKIKSYRFAPAGNFGYSKAEVTAGGVATDEIDPKTMMSRKCEGLYFLGEALDVTGELGGYNFQWAFATAQRLKIEV